MNHRNVKHCFTGVCAVLIVLAQPSALPKPAERPFHDPPFGQDDEAFRLIGTLYNLQTHLPIAAQRYHPDLDTVSFSGADNPASRNLSRRLCVWTRGSVVPDKTAKAR